MLAISRAAVYPDAMIADNIAQAVDFIVRYHREPVFLDYRRRCLAMWREVYGDPFTDRVVAEVQVRWKTTRGEKDGRKTVRPSG